MSGCCAAQLVRRAVGWVVSDHDGYMLPAPPSCAHIILPLIVSNCTRLRDQDTDQTRRATSVSWALSTLWQHKGSESASAPLSVSTSVLAQQLPWSHRQCDDNSEVAMGLSLIDENEEDPESDDIKTIHHRQERVTSFTLPSSIIHRCVFSSARSSGST